MSLITYIKNAFQRKVPLAGWYEFVVTAEQTTFYHSYEEKQITRKLRNETKARLSSVRSLTGYYVWHTAKKRVVATDEQHAQTIMKTMLSDEGQGWTITDVRAKGPHMVKAGS